MSDRMEVSIMLGDGRIAPVENLRIKHTKKGLKLAGDAVMALVTAATMGELHYFAEKQTFGFPVKVAQENVPPVKFWWLFKACEQPKRGACKPMGWVKTAGMVAAMNCAEYSEMIMRSLFEDMVADNPHALAWSLQDVLAWQMDMFGNSPMDDAKVKQRLVHDDEQDDVTGLFRKVLVGCYITFLDGSVLRLDEEGISAMDTPQYVVPVPASAAKGKQAASAAMPCQLVTPHPTQDGREWYQ